MGAASLFDEMDPSVVPPIDLICEAYDEYIGVSLNTARAFANANMLTNTIQRDYELNCMNAELRCLKHGGTADDYAFYEDAAGQGALGKLKSIIDKVIQFWKDLCHKMKMTIQTKICTAQAKKSVGKMKKVLALNPGLGNTKVTAPDMSSALKVISKYRGVCDINNARYIKGILATSQAKGIGATISDFNKAFDKATVGSAATCVLTLTGLVLAIESEMDALPKALGNLEERENVILERLASTVSDRSEVSATAALQAAANFRVQLGKQELDTHMKYLHDLIQIAKEKILNLQGKGTINANVREEAEDTGNPEDQTFAEEGSDNTPETFEESGDDEFLDSLFEGVL